MTAGSGKAAMRDGPLIRTRVVLDGGELTVTYRHASRRNRTVVDTYRPGDTIPLMTLARILRTSRRTVYNWANSGKLPTRRMKGPRRGSSRWAPVPLSVVVELLRDRGDLPAKRNSQWIPR